MVHHLKDVRFGKLVALQPIAKRYRSFIVWRCRCDCGNERNVISSNLVRGNTQSCGCSHEKYKRNLCNRKFGRLLVIRKTKERRNRQVVWECLCDCGNTTFVLASSLVNGLTRSCGCFQKERAKETMTKHGLWGTKAYMNMHQNKYRTKKLKSNSIKIDPRDLLNRMEKFGNRCVYCGGKYEETDHVIPISRGGSHTLENLVPSCRHCNRSKGNRLINLEWKPPLKGWVAYV